MNPGGPQSGQIHDQAPDQSRSSTDQPYGAQYAAPFGMSQDPDSTGFGQPPAPPFAHPSYDQSYDPQAAQPQSYDQSYGQHYEQQYEPQVPVPPTFAPPAEAAFAATPADAHPAFGQPLLIPGEPPIPPNHYPGPDAVSQFTEIPPPPSMASPYGTPLRSGEVGTLVDADPEATLAQRAKRRRTLLVSSVAAVAVVGIGAGVALLGGGGDSRNDAGRSTRDSNGRTTTDTKGGSLNGAQLPIGVDGATVDGTPTAAATAPGATPATPGQTTAPGAPTSSGPVAPGPGGGTTGAPAQPAHTTTKPPAPVTQPPAGPPSSDCGYLNLPPNQMPTLNGGPNGTAMQQLQCLLKKSMLNIKTLAVDGEWGPATAQALNDFVNCSNSPSVSPPGGRPPYQISANGVVDSRVWADLYFWDNQYTSTTYYYCNGTRPA